MPLMMQAGVCGTRPASSGDPCLQARHPRSWLFQATACHPCPSVTTWRASSSRSALPDSNSSASGGSGRRWPTKRGNGQPASGARAGSALAPLACAAPG